MTLTLDAAKTTLHVHTFAEGLLSRLAHDLEITASDVRGTAERGVVSKVNLEVPVASLRVAGAVKKGKLDASVLSASDRADIEGRMRGEVLAGASAVHVEGEIEGRRARLTVRGPSGVTTVACDVTLTEQPGGGAVEAAGKCDLSLRGLGLQAIKGPMGAFRLSDRVEVVFRAVFRESAG